MSGQIAGPSVLTLEAVGFVIGVSMLLGAADLVRQPGWAWKRAEENKAAYLVLVLLLPLVGLAMYIFNSRPKVVKVASAGRAASLPFERYGDEIVHKQLDERLAGAGAPPVGFGSFGAISFPTGAGSTARSVPSVEPAGLGTAGAASAGAASAGTASAGAASAGAATATQAPWPRVPVSRPYHPKQRASLEAPDDTTPAVPAGWKADPTGRHQFRYWDGFHWTESVADAGIQARDAVSS